MFPELISARDLRGAIDDAVGGFVEQYSYTFEQLGYPLLRLLIFVENVFTETPWWLMLIAITGLSWWAGKKASLALLVAAVTFFIGFIGLWELGMQTLALMLVSISFALAIGIPVGVCMSYSRTLRAVMKPVLDVMQTLPIFVYLIPVVMLFGLGKVPAVIATVVYAVPPVIRLTDLGIRLVNREVLEAADAFGASGIGKLFRVQLPLAIPNIMAGINQTTMMALAMVVIASMIGARGLGQEVLTGINRLEIGRGLLSGLAIVALAIIFDRITQAIGVRFQSRTADQKEVRK